MLLRDLAESPALQSKMICLMQARRMPFNHYELLDALDAVPREAFIASMFHARAYEESSLPIDAGQTINPPLLWLSMLDMLQLNDRLHVLHIGTGSGYSCAVLSQLVRRVITVELNEELAGQAQNRLNNLGFRNVTVNNGNGLDGWEASASYDRIIVTAALRAVPAELLHQLAPNGVLLAPVGKPSGPQRLMSIRRKDDGFRTQHHQDVLFDPLVEKI